RDPDRPPSDDVPPCRESHDVRSGHPPRRHQRAERSTWPRFISLRNRLTRTNHHGAAERALVVVRSRTVVRGDRRFPDSPTYRGESCDDREAPRRGKRTTATDPPTLCPNLDRTVGREASPTRIDRCGWGGRRLR